MARGSYISWVIMTGEFYSVTAENQRVRDELDARLADLNDIDVVRSQLTAILTTGTVDSEVTRLPEGLAADAERFLNGERVQAVASWLPIADALAGVTLRASPSASAIINAAVRLRDAEDWVHDAFYAACCVRIHGLEQAARDRWLDACGSPPPPADTPPVAAGPVTTQRREVVRTVVDPFDLWTDSFLDIERVARHTPLNLLEVADPERWFRAVEGWRDARLAQSAVFCSRALRDPAILLRCVLVAHPAFDADGRWTGFSGVLLLAKHVVALAESAVDNVWHRHSGEVTERETAVTAFQDAELSEYFDRAWTAVVARPDGMLIAIHLAAWLARRCVDMHGRDSAVHALGFRSLCAALAARPTNIAEMRACWERMRALYPTQRVVLSGLGALRCAVELERLDAPRESLAFSWFADLLCAGIDDVDWRYWRDTGELLNLIKHMSAMFARSSSIVTRCEEVYAKLARGRRQGEFGYTLAQSDADYGSILLYAFVVSLLLEQHASGMAAEAQDAMERWFPRILRLALVSSSGSPAFSATAVLLSAIIARVRLCPDRLPESIAPVLNHPTMAAAVIAQLLPSVGTGVIERAIVSQYATISELHERAAEWARVTARDHELEAVRMLGEALQHAARWGPQAAR